GQDTDPCTTHRLERPRNEIALGRHVARGRLEVELIGVRPRRLEGDRVTQRNRAHDGANLVVPIRSPTEDLETKIDLCWCFDRAPGHAGTSRSARARLSQSSKSSAWGRWVPSIPIICRRDASSSLPIP